MKTTHAAALGVALAVAGPALAQGSNQEARYLAANCANCHGSQGVAKGNMPSLAGQPAAITIEQMEAFRADKRPATIMHQIAKGYTPEQVRKIAEFFAAQPRTR